MNAYRVILLNNSYSPGTGLARKTNVNKFTISVLLKSLTRIGLHAITKSMPRSMDAWKSGAKSPQKVTTAGFPTTQSIDRRLFVNSPLKVKRQCRDAYFGKNLFVFIYTARTIHTTKI